MKTSITVLLFLITLPVFGQLNLPSNLVTTRRTKVFQPITKAEMAGNNVESEKNLTATEKDKETDTTEESDKGYIFGSGTLSNFENSLAAPNPNISIGLLMLVNKPYKGKKSEPIQKTKNLKNRDSLSKENKDMGKNQKGEKGGNPAIFDEFSENTEELAASESTIDGVEAEVKNAEDVNVAGIYAQFNSKPALSADSNSLYKTFLFPEISARAFTLGGYINFRPKPLTTGSVNWKYSLWTEFSISSFKSRDSFASKSAERLDSTKGSGSFTAISGIVGFKISGISIVNNKSFKQAALHIFPYFSIVSVDAKSAAAYYTLLKGNDLPTLLISGGVRVDIELGNFRLFFDGKNTLNKFDKANMTNDLRGFNFTIGSSISTSIFTL